MNPLLFMIPATIASNFAFLFPVGTPANAIVYEHAGLKMSDMVRDNLGNRDYVMFSSIAKQLGVKRITGKIKKNAERELTVTMFVVVESVSSTVVAFVKYSGRNFCVCTCFLKR